MSGGRGRRPSDDAARAGGQAERPADDAAAVEAALARATAAAGQAPAGTPAHLDFLIDECVTLLLVGVAHTFGHQASHVAHRGWGGLKDGQLRVEVFKHGLVLVTNNRDDWRGIMAHEELHPGLVVIVENAPRAREVDHFVAALRHIAAMRDLTNRVVEVEADGRVHDYLLPPLG